MTSQSAEDPLAERFLPRPSSPPSRASRLHPSPVFQMPLLQNVEDISMYEPGGHHPVDLGDVIEHRFKIIHKLGNGGFALVWLARDLQRSRYVALKILKADAEDREVKVLEHLNNVAGNVRITNLQETFVVHGPNGSHQCLVLDLGGPSLARLTLYSDRLPLSFLKTAARTLADGLAALHAAGICHGDLTHSNVLFEITGIQDWTEDEIYRHLGPPMTAPLLLLDGTPGPESAPAHVVDAIDWSHLNTKHLSSNVLITDFGEAFFEHDAPEGLGTPASFLAPELLFGYRPSHAADLWALGCLVFEIHAFGVLIPTFFGSSLEAVAMAVETVGALPEAWQASYHDKETPLEAESPGEKHRFFDDGIERTRTLDSQILKQLPELTQDQRNTFLQLLKSTLVFEPRRRLSAAEAAGHRWFMNEAEIVAAQGMNQIREKGTGDP